MAKKTAPTVEALDYTGKYEYACSLIDLYIGREEASATSKDAIEDVFGTQSFLFNLFTTDYSAIRNDSVYQEIVKRFDTGNSDSNRDRRMPITRMTATYVDICAALGMDFMETLTENVVRALCHLACADTEHSSKNERARLDKLFHDFVRTYPTVVLFVIGNKVYLSHRERVMMKRALTTGTPRKGS